MGRWVLVTVLLIIAIIVAFVIFVVTGVIDGPALFWRLGYKITWLEPHLEIYSIGLDSQTWIQEREAIIEKQMYDLGQQRSELEYETEQLEQKIQQLEKQENEFEKQIGSFRAARAQQQSVQKLAEIYIELAPEESARILEKLEQSTILEVLLAMDTQDAANILKELPTNLAVALSKELVTAGK